MSELQDNAVGSSGVEDLNVQVQVPQVIPMDELETTTKCVERTFQETGSLQAKLSPKGLMNNVQIDSASEELKTKHAKSDAAGAFVEPSTKTHVATQASNAVLGYKLTSWPAVWLMQRNVDERVIRLVYWIEWKRTAGAFGGILFLLLALICYSFVTVVTLSALSMLSAAFLYRVSMTIVNAVQKTSAEHPFRHLLDEKIELSENAVREWSELIRTALNSRIDRLQRLFLIDDVVESLKFGVLLWLVSYIGSWISLLNIVIVAVVAVFTLPKVYELYQGQIDHVCCAAKVKLVGVIVIAESKIPAKLKFYNKEKKSQ